MKPETMQRILDAITDAFKKSFARAARLEARLAALEQRPNMTYRGVWAEGAENQPGDICTHDGSMWYCWTATKDRPGTSAAWQLCVKRGRDAR